MGTKTCFENEAYGYWEMAFYGPEQTKQKVI